MALQHLGGNWKPHAKDSTISDEVCLRAEHICDPRHRHVDRNVRVSEHQHPPSLGDSEIHRLCEDGGLAGARRTPGKSETWRDRSLSGASLRLLGSTIDVVGAFPQIFKEFVVATVRGEKVFEQCFVCPTRCQIPQAVIELFQQPC